MKRPCLVVMAKVPVRGNVKTRLAATLREDHVLLLYEAFLRDKLHQLTLVPDVSFAVAFAPADEEARMRSFCGSDVRLIPQRGSDLGERLANVAADVLEDGASGVVLLDADTPHLHPSVLADAAGALARGRVVLGPTRDGGYYAIGLCEAVRALFVDIAWSTPRVLEQTLVAAARAGLSTHRLPVWYDIDEADDLRALEAELSAGAETVAWYPAHTARALAQIGRLEEPGRTRAR